MVCRTTHHLKDLRITEETEILLTSRPAAAMNAAQIQAFRRGHWTIENPLHYVRDVTFGEDRSTVRTGHAPDNLATLRNLVIGLCALDAARNKQRASYLPRFRSNAKHDKDIAVNLLACPLLNGS